MAETLERIELFSNLGQANLQVVILFYSMVEPRIDYVFSFFFFFFYLGSALHGEVTRM